MIAKKIQELTGSDMFQIKTVKSYPEDYTETTNIAQEEKRVPYCTHEGSGLGSSERDIKKLCPNAKVLSGLAIRGGSVERADKDVANWLKKLDLIP